MISRKSMNKKSLQAGGFSLINYDLCFVNYESKKPHSHAAFFLFFIESFHFSFSFFDDLVSNIIWYFLV